MIALRYHSCKQVLFANFMLKTWIHPVAKPQHKQAPYGHLCIHKVINAHLSTRAIEIIKGGIKATMLVDHWQYHCVENNTDHQENNRNYEKKV